MARAPPNTARVGHPTLDTPKPVADAVWIVDSLLLHSPTRFSPALLERLQQIAPVRHHLLAPSFAYWVHLAAWQRACPEAVTWAVPGLRGRRPMRKSGLRLDHDLGGRAPKAWGDALGLTILPGA